MPRNMVLGGTLLVWWGLLTHSLLTVYIWFGYWWGHPYHLVGLTYSWWFMTDTLVRQGYVGLSGLLRRNKRSELGNKNDALPFVVKYERIARSHGLITGNPVQHDSSGEAPASGQHVTTVGAYSLFGFG